MSPLDDEESSPLKVNDLTERIEEDMHAPATKENAATEKPNALSVPQLLVLIISAVLLGFLGTNGYFNIKQDRSDGKQVVIHSKGAQEDPNDHRPWPRLAWLMSFPNSGTSFTLYAVREMTQMCTATNYGTEWKDKNGNSVALSDDHPEGPFLIDGEEMAAPKGDMYVLTKTHCGGRCTTCGPDAYVEDLYSFRRRCRMGFVAVYNNETKKSERFDTIMDYERISKIVHILRDPFDNVVSRFHLEKKKNYTDITNIPPTKKGFRDFCAHQIDRKFLGKERYHKIWDPKIWDLLQKVPCHSDFYRWVSPPNMLRLAWDVSIKQLTVVSLSISCLRSAIYYHS